MSRPAPQAGPRGAARRAPTQNQHAQPGRSLLRLAALPVLLIALLGNDSWRTATGHGALLAAGVVIVGAGAFCLGGAEARAFAAGDAR